MFEHLFEAEFLKVLVAAVIYFALGAIWYNPNVFGKIWMKGTGVRMEDAEGANMPLIFGTTFVVSFIAMWILNLLTMPIREISDAIEMALALWLVGTLPISAMNTAYERKPASLFVVNAFYHLVGLIAGAILFALW